MTIDEAINHCLDISSVTCGGCSDEHMQLAVWLEELKRLRVEEKIALDLLDAYGMAARHLPEQYDRVMAMMTINGFKARLRALGIEVPE
jgi:hypothetical protein